MSAPVFGIVRESDVPRALEFWGWLKSTSGPRGVLGFRKELVRYVLGTGIEQQQMVVSDKDFEGLSSQMKRRLAAIRIVATSLGFDVGDWMHLSKKGGPGLEFVASLTRSTDPDRPKAKVAKPELVKKVPVASAAARDKPYLSRRLQQLRGDVENLFVTDRDEQVELQDLEDRLDEVEELIEINKLWLAEDDLYDIDVDIKKWQIRDRANPELANESDRFALDNKLTDMIAEYHQLCDLHGKEVVEEAIPIFYTALNNIRSDMAARHFDYAWDEYDDLETLLHEKAKSLLGERKLTLSEVEEMAQFSNEIELRMSDAQFEGALPSFHIARGKIADHLIAALQHVNSNDARAAWRELNLANSALPKEYRAPPPFAMNHSALPAEDAAQELRVRRVMDGILADIDRLPPGFQAGVLDDVARAEKALASRVYLTATAILNQARHLMDTQLQRALADKVEKKPVQKKVKKKKPVVVENLTRETLVEYGKSIHRAAALAGIGSTARERMAAMFKDSAVALAKKDYKAVKKALDDANRLLGPAKVIFPVRQV